MLYRIREYIQTLRSHSPLPQFLVHSIALVRTTVDIFGPPLRKLPR